MFKDKGRKDELKLKNLHIKHAVGNPIVRRDLMKLTAVDGNPRFNSLCLPPSLSIYLSLSLCLSVCLYVSLSLSLSVCLSVCLSLSLSIYLSLSLSL